MLKSAVSIALLGIAVSAIGQTASSRHAFTAVDWSTLHSARAVAVAPNTGSVLYAVNFGGNEGPTQAQWWTVGRDGSHRHQLELPKKFRPMGFTRDGTSLYGTYHIGKLQQFAIFPLSSTPQSTPATVVMLPRGIETAMPSPDGSQYAFLFDPRPPDPLVKVRTIVEAPQTGIYVVHADGTGGEHLCAGLNHVSQVAWSPDGDSLAALSATPKIGFHFIHSFIDVCTQHGSRRVVEIPNTAVGLGWTTGQDGRKQIVFLSTTTHVLTPDHVWSVPAAGGTAEDRTPNLQGSATQLTGDPDGRIWVLVERGVQGEIDDFSKGKLDPTYKWPSGSMEGLPVFPMIHSAHDDLAFTVSDPKHSTNVAVSESGGLKKITDEGDQQLASIDLGTVRTVRWTSKDGTHLEGIATFPAGYIAGKKYPFLVLPHGGPEANDNLTFDPFSRIIAGFGYVVLQPEYRGSTGFGSDFLEAIYQHFGDRAYRDVDSATDYAIAQGWADPHRLAIFGWSAGGFMTSWTVTQTNRYRAAIEGAGITDWASFIWTSDIQQFDFDARWPAEDPEAFHRFSAVDFAKQVTTPLLILHGAADQRVPTYQGREYFEVLAARGKTVRMVTYPGSPHFPYLWQQRLDVMQEVKDWLARYNR